MTRATRTYVSPLREAGATATRRRILEAARNAFEQNGWAGATLSLIAAQAGVSPKTVQALFGSKARLLAETVDFAMRGEGHQTAARSAGSAQVRSAPTAGEALKRHAAMSVAVNARAADLAVVVEAGAAADPAVRPLWARMRENMRFGVRWAADTVRGKPGIDPGVTPEGVETVFQLAMAWSTYRTLRSNRGMTPAQIEAWLSLFYERMLLAPEASEP